MSGIEGSLRIVGKGIIYDKGTALIAGVCRGNDGDLIVAFNTGGDMSPGQRVVIIRSKDGGRTWGEPEAEFSTVFQRGGVEVGCSLSRISSGRLLLPYADGFFLKLGERQFSELFRTNELETSALLFCPYSDDNGKTWLNAKAQRFEGLQGIPFGKVIELPGGGLVMPIYGEYDRRGVTRPAVLHSRDGGVSWSGYRPIADHGNETAILRLANGRLLALIRGYSVESGDSEYPLYTAYSEDGGDTWAPARRTSMKGTSPALHLAPGGKVLAGYRSVLEGGRCHVSSSDDAGVSWAFELELEVPTGAWKSGGYPVFETLPDGTIFTSFHNASPTWHMAYNILSEA